MAVPPFGRAIRAHAITLRGPPAGATARRYAAWVDWIDVSVPIRSGMVVCDGDPEVVVERVSDLARGDDCAVSRIELGSHTGTHIDAPAHFLARGAGVDRLPLDVLVGPALVVDVAHLPGDIDAAALAAIDVPAGTERLLLRTACTIPWDRDRTGRHTVGVAVDAARELVARGVRLVGIDDLSVAPSADPGPSHVILLEAGVVVVEGLDLRAVPAGSYDLVCLPLRIEDGDGAPARALLRPIAGRSL